MKRWGSDPGAFQAILSVNSSKIFYESKEASDCKFWIRKMIGTLNQMASTQLKNICSHEVKKTYKQEKAAFESIIRVLVQQQRFEFSSRFPSRKPDALWGSPRTGLCYSDL